MKWLVLVCSKSEMLILAYSNPKYKQKYWEHEAVTVMFYSYMPMSIIIGDTIPVFFEMFFLHCCWIQTAALWHIYSRASFLRHSNSQSFLLKGRVHKSWTSVSNGWCSSTNKDKVILTRWCHVQYKWRNKTEGKWNITGL